MDTWPGMVCEPLSHPLQSNLSGFPKSPPSVPGLAPCHTLLSLAHTPTTEALQDEVEFATCLESIGQFYNEGVLH